MKRVLIVGASSFVGSHLSVLLRPHYRVFGTYSSTPMRVDDITTFRFSLRPGAAITDFFRTLKPDAVVYCAAVRDEKKCRANPNGSFFVNVQAANLFAAEAKAAGARFVFISSSKVFSGDRGNYSEDDRVDPISEYGKMKWRAEQTLEYSGSFILRLGTVFGISPSGRLNDFQRILHLLWAKKEQKYIDDEFRTFISVHEVTSAIAKMLDAPQEYSGIYHLSNGDLGRDSYYSFARRVAAQFGLPADCLHPISGNEFSEKEESFGDRGADLTLQGTRFEQTFTTKIGDSNSSLQKIRQELRLGKQ